MVDRIYALLWIAVTWEANTANTTEHDISVPVCSSQNAMAIPLSPHRLSHNFSGTINFWTENGCVKVYYIVIIRSTAIKFRYITQHSMAFRGRNFTTSQQQYIIRTYTDNTTCIICVWCVRACVWVCGSLCWIWHGRIVQCNLCVG